MIYYGNKKLAQKSNPVIHGTDCTDLLEDMFDEMDEHDGVGLAAIQIGVPLTVFVWNEGVNRGVAINPFVQTSMDVGTHDDYEGCLSVPGYYHPLVRDNYLALTAYDERWNEFTVRITPSDPNDFFARIIQHEMDHLNGVCVADYANRETRRKLAKQCPK